MVIGAIFIVCILLFRRGIVGEFADFAVAPQLSVRILNRIVI